MIELARWLHVGSVQHGRTQDGEQPEREERRDCDESEKSQEIRTQQETEGRRGSETGKAIAESAAAAASADSQVLIASQPPRKSEWRLFRGIH